MKKSLIFGMGVIGLVAAIPFASNTPVLANLQQAGEALVKVINRPEVKLQLTAYKQEVEVNEKGVELVDWKALDDGAIVNPGDTLRYTVTSENIGDMPAKNLVVTQPIPQQTVYKLNSAKSNNGPSIIYSVDGGETFSAEPTIQVKLDDGTVETRPAPAEAYTHIRWEFNKDIDPEVGVKAMYEVNVPNQ